MKENRDTPVVIVAAVDDTNEFHDERYCSDQTSPIPRIRTWRTFAYVPLAAIDRHLNSRAGTISARYSGHDGEIARFRSAAELPLGDFDIGDRMDAVYPDRIKRIGSVRVTRRGGDNKLHFLARHFRPERDSRRKRNTN